MKLRVSPLIAMMVASLVACGGSVSGDGTSTVDSGATGDDSGTATSPASDAATTTPTTPDAAPETPAVDHGAPSDKYPAFTPDMPQLQNNGGNVLDKPTVVTITWPGDKNAAWYEAFGDNLGASDYWNKAVSEYGVGPSTSGPTNHVRLTTPPPSPWADSDIQNWVAQQASDPKTSGWPAPTPNTIYVLYLPQGTSLTISGGRGGGGDACSQGVGGYHNSTTLTDGSQVAFAVLPACSFPGAGSLRDETTLSASHEVGEASTDPYPQTSTPTYVGVDDNHIAWLIFMQGNAENGDLCEVYRDSGMRVSGGGLDGYEVQRMWSNASATAGHNPCVPVPSGPYFNVAPLDLAKIKGDASAFGGSGTFYTKGIEIPVGSTKTFTVGLYSDAKVAPWNLDVKEGSAFAPPRTSHFSASVDLSSGTNGQKAVVSVTVNSKPTSRFGAGYGIVTVVSSDAAGNEHYMPVLIHVL